MEAITILTNESNHHRLLQIDLDVLAKTGEELEDVYDIIAVEVRKQEDTIPWEEVKQEMQQKGE